MLNSFATDLRVWIHNTHHHLHMLIRLHPVYQTAICCSCRCFRFVDQIDGLKDQVTEQLRRVHLCPTHEELSQHGAKVRSLSFPERIAGGRRHAVVVTGLQSHVPLPHEDLGVPLRSPRTEAPFPMLPVPAMGAVSPSPPPTLPAATMMHPTAGLRSFEPTSRLGSWQEPPG